MSGLRDWTKLDARWYEDADLLACADDVAECFQMWPVLVAKAKADSHAATNPDGTITIAPRRLAFDARCSIDSIGPALQVMTDHGLLTFTAEGTKELRITLAGFSKWQAPRRSAADRQARYRENKKAAISRGSDGVSQVRDGQCHEVTRREGEEREKRGDVDKTLPSVRAHASAPAHEAASGGGGDAGFNQVERIAAELARYRRDIGNLSLDLQSAESAIRDERGIDIEPTWLLEHLYRPTAAMLHEYGRDATRAALAAIAKRPDVVKPKPYMRTVAEREAAKPAGPVKPAETFQERKARDDKAAMLASLQIHTVIKSDPEAV